MNCKKVIFMVLIMALMVTASFADVINVVDDQRAYLQYGWWQDAKGLSVKVPSLTTGIFSFVEFDLGIDVVPEATLNLYNSDGGLVSDLGWVVEVRGAEYDMTETVAVVGYSTWGLNGSFPITTTGAACEGWYDADITSFYNANLGKTVTFWLVPEAQIGTGSGPKFEDSEGTMGTAAKFGGTIAAPYINTVPEPSTMLLLSAGLGMMIRRRRKI